MTHRTFLMPDVGEGLTEAEIVTWKVNVGDTVTLNQPLVDIETAKATVELPSPFVGVVSQLHGNVGDVIEVGNPLIEIEESNESSSDAVATSSGPSARTAVFVGYGTSEENETATRRHRRTPSKTSVPVAAPLAPVLASTTGSSPVRSTPPVRLYAKQHGLDISLVAGTGRDGLVTRDDVERALSTSPRRSSPSAAGAPSRFVGHDLAPWDTGPKEERIPVRGVLRSMAEAMVHSAFSAPHAAVWVRVDASATMELVSSLKKRPSLANVRLSPLVIVALGLCDAARTYPGINSSFDEANAEVVIRRSVSLGIAADTPRGLIAPNIKNADQLDLVGMALALEDLVTKARAGTTAPSDMLGTTLSITNVGPMGVDGAVPILPPGTSAILVVGQITKAPWVRDNEVVVRDVVEIGLSFDHRHIDGALASGVLSHVGRFLTDPAPALLAR
jgi:pyruvate dehydrogenase E2 component (dihydrolipoamide acetyltransferase)